MGECERIGRVNAEVPHSDHFEIELPIIKQGEFELAADLGCVRQLQEELRSRCRAGSSYLWCSRRLPIRPSASIIGHWKRLKAYRPMRAREVEFDPEVCHADNTLIFAVPAQLHVEVEPPAEAQFLLWSVQLFGEVRCHPTFRSMLPPADRGLLMACTWRDLNAGRRYRKSRPAARLRLLFREISADSRNSPGPFRSRRFLCCCSSAVADGSASLSICWPARSMAFDVAFGLRRFMSCDPASPSSTSRRMASERSGLSVCLAAQASTFSRNSGESPIAVTGSRPWPACLSFFAQRFCVTSSYFLYYPGRQHCPKDKGRACGMGVHGQPWRASATTTAAPITSAVAFLRLGASSHFEPLRIGIMSRRGT